MNFGYSNVSAADVATLSLSPKFRPKLKPLESEANKSSEGEASLYDCVVLPSKSPRNPTETATTVVDDAKDSTLTKDPQHQLGIASASSLRLSDVPPPPHGDVAVDSPTTPPARGPGPVPKPGVLTGRIEEEEEEQTPYYAKIVKNRRKK